MILYDLTKDNHKSASKIGAKESMANRYVWGLIIILIGAMLAVPGVVGFSDASRIPAAHGNYSQIKATRAPRNLVLRSASALVEDQMTGECLIQKQAEAIMPIASITKLMTAMVVLDAKMDLEESITISSEDVDKLRHSHSRLPVNTSSHPRRCPAAGFNGFRKPRCSCFGADVSGRSRRFCCCHECQGQVAGTRRDTLRRSHRHSLRQRLLCQRLGADGGRRLPISPYPGIHHMQRNHNPFRSSNNALP